MYYTCKDCCIIMKELAPCPICNNEDTIVPINIEVQSSVRDIPSIED
ncbi:hypothetical protein [Bacillus solimangrovi]|nr:hypothetical protein [Bacillus solimangrovi]